MPNGSGTQKCYGTVSGRVSAPPGFLSLSFLIQTDALSVHSRAVASHVTRDRPGEHVVRLKGDCPGALSLSLCVYTKKNCITFSMFNKDARVRGVRDARGETLPGNSLLTSSRLLPGSCRSRKHSPCRPPARRTSRPHLPHHRLSHAPLTVPDSTGISIRPRLQLPSSGAAR